MYKLTPLLDLTDYDDRLKKLETHFTQSETYRLWQEKAGRDVRVFVLEKESENTFTPIFVFLALIHTISFGKKILDIPHGPVALSNPSEEDNKNLIKKIREFIKQEKIVFARINSKNNPGSNLKPVAQFHYQAGIFQPRFEWLVDTTQDLDTLMAKMKKGTRYSIRLAEQKEVKVEIITDNLDRYLDEFYNLTIQTGKRNGFRSHSKEYYEKIFKTIYNTDSLFLTVASYKNKILAMNVIFCFGNQAVYLYSASSDEHKDLQASYLAQWTSIEEVKRRGITKYSLGGITPDEFPSQYHSWRSITSFKKKFPGQETDYGLWFDIPNQTLWYYFYCLYRFIQKIRP